MKKILLFANTSWYLWNFRKNFVERLVAKKYDVVILAPDELYREKLVSIGARFYFLSMSIRGTHVLQEIETIMRVMSIYRRIRPDVALHFTIKPLLYGSIAAKLSGAVSVNTVTGLGYLFLDRGDAKIKFSGFFIYRLIRDLPGWTFFQNEDDRQLLLQSNLVRVDRSSVISGSGVDLFFFRPEARRVRSEKFQFLYVGRVLKNKGLNELAEAARMLKQEGLKFDVKILGSLDEDCRVGIEPALFQQWIEDGLFTYEGFSEDVRAWVRECDCIILPSYREGVPRALLEAAACGRPAIASDVPGCREIVKQDQTGLLCAPHDSLSLADAMRRMYNFPEEKREQLGSNGRSLAIRKFDQDLIIDAYLTKVIDLIG